ncbi:MAG: nuclear cap-binding protein subunit 3 [Candidatus Pacebacteria bacterium]|nr:nuclear cap-binding protein subunit 3 [Candidatus Paceibacterota bacterium]
MNKRYERLKKFGFPAADTREPPVEPSATATFLPHTIYVYGLDSMSTDDVKMYFQKADVDAFSWLNDSSCILPRRRTKCRHDQV